MNLRWMWLDHRKKTPDAVMFSCEFNVDESGEIKFNCSADEFCDIFIDGRFYCSAPESSAPQRWYYTPISLKLAPGKHVFTARVYALGSLTLAPVMSIRPGFACDLKGDWRCRRMSGISFSAPWPDWGGFPRYKLGKNYSDQWLSGKGKGWKKPFFFDDDRKLFSPDLPPGKFDLYKKFHHETPCRICFDEYVCVRPQYVFSGEGRVRLRWSETGYLSNILSKHTLKGEKGRRDGKNFFGTWDEIKISGKMQHTDFIWRAGRYLEIECSGTAKVEKMSFHRVGYRYPAVKFPRGKWQKAMEISFRTLECCSHDAFMDCPFYERMMYIGDARCEALALYALKGNPSLVRKALIMTSLSQSASGMLMSRYPCKIPSEIPSFVPVWILMLYDYLHFTGDKKTVAELLPVAEKIADFFRNSQKDDGLLYLPGWGFIDWQWPRSGVPFGSECGTNSIINLLAVLAMNKLAGIEQLMGNESKGKAYLEFADKLYDVVTERFFDIASARMADDTEKMFFSEHAQILSLMIKYDEKMVKALRKGIFNTRCGIFFSCFYLEACRKCGEKQLFYQRLKDYCQLEKVGLTTLPEDFLAPRSDCHAWGAHILYHLLTPWK